MQPVIGRVRRCCRAHRDFEEPEDFKDLGDFKDCGDFKDRGDFCRRPVQLMLSGKARVTNRIINLYGLS